MTLSKESQKAMWRLVADGLMSLPPIKLPEKIDLGFDVEAYKRTNRFLGIATDGEGQDG